MTSKFVLNHQKSGQSVSASIKTHTPNIVAALQQKLSGLLREGETLPDIAAFVALLDRLCVHNLDALTQADQHLETERLEDKDARSDRDLATKALFDTLSDLSATITYIFGDSARANLHLSGPTPNDPTQLAELATRVANALAKPSLPPSRRTNATFDAPTTMETLRAQTQRVRETLALAADEPRETERALIHRDDAARTYNTTFTRVATIFEQLCELAGESALAARVRRTASKPGRTLEDPIPSAPTSDQAP